MMRRHFSISEERSEVITLRVLKTCALLEFHFSKVVFSYAIFQNKRIYSEMHSPKMAQCIRDYISDELIGLGLRKVFIGHETYFEPSTRKMIENGPAKRRFRTNRIHSQS